MSDTRAAVLLSNLWYMIAQQLFDKVCKVTDLNKEQIEALRSIALRPMDFGIACEVNPAVLEMAAAEGP
jgi:hypothetical protein